MKKKKIFKYAGICFALLLLMAPDICLGWDDGMEVLNYYFDIDTTPRHQWGPKLDYNPIDNEFMLVWRSGGPLRDDCEEGDDEECTGDFKTVNGQRVSPDGELLGDLIQWSPPEPLMKGYARIAHNVFTNEYMVTFVWGPGTPRAEQYIARVDSMGNMKGEPKRLNEGGDVLLTELTFNPTRREYLVVYNDRYFNESLNNVGFILDESGNPIHGPFPVGEQVGDFYAPSAAYNSANDTYLVVWEDFRHVTDWLYEPCDIYGTLLDAEGKTIKDIAIVDDHDMPGGSDQRVPEVEYNPNRNEFLIAWRDDDPALDNYGIMGMIIGPDGTPKGPEFLVIDPPGMQGIMELLYIEDEKKYFGNWTDTRDATDPGLYYFLSDRADIYAIWLDESGRPIGDEIPISTEPEVQMHAEMAYDPVMKRFIFAWYDYYAPNDYGIEEEATTISSDIPGDVRGTIYGAPSFLSGRVVEEGTGNPVEGALTMVMGPSLPAFKETNVGGWFNVVKNSQPNGKYLVIALKLGCLPAIQLVNYAGDPVRETIEVKKLW